MLTALHWLYITCDQAVLLPFFLGGEGTFAFSIKEKKGLITGYIVYEPIQFSDAGVVEKRPLPQSFQPLTWVI